MVYTEEEKEAEELHRVNGACPFCNAERETDDGVNVTYRCGSSASRTDGKHIQNCKRD